MLYILKCCISKGQFSYTITLTQMLVFATINDEETYITVTS